MTKRIKSTPLNVQTLYSPLSDMITLEILGNVGIRQWYYAGDDSYSPDYSLTPLQVRPVVMVYDSDTGTSYKPTYTSVVWKVIEHDGSAVSYVSEDPSADYSVENDGYGTLTVRKNYQANPPVLECTVVYQDSRSGEANTITATLQLFATTTSDSGYSLKIQQNRRWWNPLSNEGSPINTFTATVYNGMNVMSTGIKYFWYYLHNGQEVLVNHASDPCLAYVSGQGTASLTVNMDYEAEDVEYLLRIAVDWTDASGNTHPASEATAPNIQAVARAVTRWRLALIKGRVYSINGDTTRDSIMRHGFGIIYQQQGEDLDENRAKEFICNDWVLQQVVRNASTGALTTTRTAIGSGPAMEVMERDLANNNKHQNAVLCEGHLKSPYKVVVQDGKAVVQDGENVLSREIGE